MKSIGLLALILTVGVSGAAYVVFAEDDHAHAHHGHALSGPELGISAGYVHLEEEEEDALGLHAHLLHRLGDHGIQRHLAIGLGAEYLFADEEHYALMVSLAAYPWRGLVLSVSPGVQWAEHEGDAETEYSTHLEATYVFPFGEYDIGPVVDYSWTKDESHYMLGLHIGIHL
ncbi:MAG: hypothetical protein QGH15_19105 [Kiritimatiellia bacterium]|jgi:hypothetical protein|nr:hypothetical protein [Kiritimatiellia bacterium]